MEFNGNKHELQQSRRAELREKFLRMIESMEGVNIEINMYQGAQVDGIFRAADYDISNIHVSKLNTPIGTVPEAVLRTTDIVAIKFKTQK